VRLEFVPDVEKVQEIAGTSYCPLCLSACVCHKSVVFYPVGQLATTCIVLFTLQNLCNN